MLVSLVLVRGGGGGCSGDGVGGWWWWVATFWRRGWFDVECW